MAKRGRPVQMETLVNQMVALLVRIVQTAVEQTRASVAETPVKKSKVSRPKGKRGPGRPKGSKNKTVAETPTATDGEQKKRGRKPNAVTQMVMDGLASLKTEALKKAALDIFHSAIEGVRVASPRKVKKLLAKIATMDGRKARVARRLIVTPDEQKVIKDMKAAGLKPRVLSAIFHLNTKELAAALSDKVIDLTPPVVEKDEPKVAKRGRPKGSKNKVSKTETVAAPTGEKRGRGRPKGSKNKAKTEVAKVKKTTVQVAKPEAKVEDATRPAVITAPTPVVVTTPAMAPAAAPEVAPEAAPQAATPAAR